MIYLIHENNEVVEVLDNEFNPMAFDFEISPWSVHYINWPINFPMSS